MLGRRSPEATLSATDRPEDRCEAQFYIGEWYLLRGEKEPATKALRAAADTCPRDFIEYSGAVAELKRLNPP
jgi:hypothetical protein